MIRGDDARLSRYETSENRPARRTRPVYIREILPRFLRLRETGSLRRLSLDISSVPGIAAPPRGYLLANRTTRRVPSISQPRDFPPRPSRTSASAFIIYMIFARDQQNHRSNTRVDRRRKRWPFDTANPTVKPSAISTTLRFPFFFFYIIFTFGDLTRDFDLSTIIPSVICTEAITERSCIKVTYYLSPIYRASQEVDSQCSHHRLHLFSEFPSLFLLPWVSSTAVEGIDSNASRLSSSLIITKRETLRRISRFP